MTFDKLWVYVEQSNPGMVKNGSANVNLEQFKRAMKMAYDQGQCEALKSTLISDDKSWLSELLNGGLFGGREKKVV